jgi:putative endonuclease
VSDARRALGASGEDAVASWYEARGCAVLARNWRVREGELDVVARCAGVLVFCEVKTRRSDRYGSPAEAVTAAKRRRLRRLASLWLAANPGAGRAELRFDVASVTPDGRGGLAVDVLEHAF